MASESIFVRRSRAFALAANAVALLTGALSLLGWIVDAPVLKSGLTGQVTMKANAALGLCVVSGALLVLLCRPRNSLAYQVARAAGAFAAVLGLVTLSEHVLGWNAGIDQLLFHEPAGALATASPGRMGPPACLCFMLLGSGCLLIDYRTARGRSPAQWLALLALPLALLALLGYLTGAAQLYGIARYTGIALNTAAAFLCLGLALFVARPELKPAALVVADDPGGAVARTMLPVAVTIPVVLSWLRLRGEAAGLHDEAFGHALTLLVLLITFALISWRTALRLSTVASERQRLEEQRAQLLDSERAARREAERAAALKDEFLATLSHELRTPLNAILGWTAILKRVPNRPSDIERPLEVIERSARVQVQLINDLLDISRIVSGKLRLDLEPVDVAQVVGAAIKAMLPVAKGQRVSIDSNLDSELPILAGDTSRLQQVVWNLLSNAVKFTPAGGKVEVQLSRMEDRIELSVRDTGIGIVPEFLPHVFDRFRQADSSTSRAHTGLGLGLSIVKQLVEMHGGTVAVSSEGKNRGSLFVVSLPVNGESSGVMSSPTVPVLSATALSGLKVLVVDDDRDSRELMARVLSESQAEVRLAVSTEEALAELMREPAQILVSDIGMPGKSGYDLISAVRNDTDATTMPAIAVTAFARPDDRSRALAAGFQQHIAKPINPSTLVLTIAVLTGRVDTDRRPAI
jgi:signal transduction histidine kinase/ActR/RegA family two-component response regulator